MYANGRRVDRDLVWAYAWLHLAAAQNSGFTELRDQVGKEITPDEIAGARGLAAQKRAEIAQEAN